MAHSFAAASAMLALVVTALVVGVQLLARHAAGGMLGALEFIPGYQAPAVTAEDVSQATAAILVLTALGYGVGLLAGVPIAALEQRLWRANALGVDDIVAALDGPAAEPATTTAEIPAVAPAAAVEPQAPVRAVVQYGHVPLAPRAGTSGARRRIAATRTRSAARARARYRTP
ncbi:hypothetical protein [Cellulosimicrobium sp. Marseille-Q4280]|uniref:hypothetical protein n=1 Tax=Cellulosimicrobium sp. Marseille-Q4280 TaxID=2937992 RepID=UPI00203C92C4|nr:hypothetical protein [Cellulosimicrobium sp. Marseille-Q4280]